MSIEIRHVTHIYDAGTPHETRALDGIDLTIGKGTVFGLVGGIGSGKSTLASLMAGLDSPSDGSITIDGEVPSPGKNVGILFQQPEDLFFERTLFKDMVLGLTHLGLSEEEVEKRIFFTLDQVGLSKQILSRSPFHLNRGTLRLAAFASVLVMNPGYLILDEPTASLDPGSRKRLVEIIKRISEDITIIYISHRLQEVIEVSDRLVVLDKGNITFNGTRSDYLDWGAGQDGGEYLPILNQILYRLHQLGLDVDLKVTQREDVVEQIRRTLERT
ncbi:MAG: energy-coupling factor ABC transporter ATP-binding protein [ANME-2 cluster archaeon]|nr:energy-coupling factor ABC transporter ATP-binding protein [ANME-2 cluster archaeon]